AEALNTVTHAVSLIASYLQVPLRYPLRLGGSRSYINDHAASIDPASSDLSLDTTVSANVKPAEFPLFLEGQDTTRAAYAVFLLNKVGKTVHVCSSAFTAHFMSLIVDNLAFIIINNIMVELFGRYWIYNI
ncbi:hypothetical protein ES288_D02G034200v1, partial [Gossypium darwinii]